MPPQLINTLVTLLSCFVAVNSQPNITPSNTSLPVVDLGYELQRATFYNSTGDYFSFSNIRYAAPPSGEYRFRAPWPPVMNRSAIQTGQQDRACPQAYPVWSGLVTQYLPLCLAGQTQFDPSQFQPVASPDVIPPQLPGSTEDCLFLDVVVPRKIFESRGKGYGAPVLVCFFGGGFVQGTKDDRGNPAGLICASQEDGGSGMIYVSMNYRLGAFGFMSGPTFQADGDANAGLLDQRLALEWVQKYISFFGGDPNRVTVRGESAEEAPLFTKSQHTAQAKALRRFNRLFPSLLASSLCHRKTLRANFPRLSLIAECVQQCTEATLRDTPAGECDSSAVSFVWRLRIRANSGWRLCSCTTRHPHPGWPLSKRLADHDRTQCPRWPKLHLPLHHQLHRLPQHPHQHPPHSPRLALHLHLYPPISPNTHYTSQIARHSALIQDLEFACNTYYLNAAFLSSYAYIFGVPPALHAQDVPYTFFNGPNGGIVKNVSVAGIMQSWIVDFVERGDPNGGSWGQVPVFGRERAVVRLEVRGTKVERDDETGRCGFWQKGVFY